jgi:tricorn protease-like protein
MDWTADGSSVLYTSRGTLRSYRLYQVPAAGGPSERVKIEFMSHASHGPSGNKITFTRFLRSFDAWFHYQGGMQNEVWVGDTKKGEFTRITETPGTSEYPTWAGSDIYFANEQHAKFRLMATKPSGGGSKTVVGPYDIMKRASILRSITRQAAKQALSSST